MTRKPVFKIQENKFVDLCVMGQHHIEDIDDFIDEWHEGEGDEDLHEFLGMSWEEYALWVSNPYVLPYIIKARKENKRIQDVLQEKSPAFG